MAAVCKAAAVAEQLVSCTDPDKKGIFARGSVQTCHGKVDFELERDVLATENARMINHHIIINGQRLDDNLSFSLFSIGKERISLRLYLFRMEKKLNWENTKQMSKEKIKILDIFSLISRI